MDPDPDPTLFGGGAQDVNKKVSKFFWLVSYCRYRYRPGKNHSSIDRNRTDMFIPSVGNY
jgi:hypothetical protein